MMGNDSRLGFTIIEVMLFLAVTGLMIAAMFIGVSGAINRERYNDAVASFTDYMQGQYNLVDNVRNNRGVSASGCGSESRGQSDCTVVGRVVYSNDGNGREVVSKPLISEVDQNNYDESSEDNLLTSMQLAWDSFGDADTDTYGMSWGTRVYTDRYKSNFTFAAMIIRIPGGAIKTYTRGSLPTNVQDFWQDSSNINLCVDSASLVGSGNSGIRLRNSATNSASVEYIPPGETACNG